MVKYSHNGTYSQFGEEGIVNEVFRRLGIEKGVAVEFGAPTRGYCSNTLHLEAKGWTCYFYDINPSDPKVVQMEINPGNINTLPECNLISIDTDGVCYELWKAYEGKPEMVIIEINSSLDPEVDFYHYSKGANYSIMRKLGEAKGYTLLCHTGNMLFIRNDHAKKFKKDIDVTFNRSWQ